MACDAEGTAWLHMQGWHLFWGGPAGHWTGTPRNNHSSQGLRGPFLFPSRCHSGLTRDLRLAGAGLGGEGKAGPRGWGQEQWGGILIVTWLLSTVCVHSSPLGTWGRSGHGPW